MLTKQDLIKIENLIQENLDKSLKAAFQNFYVSIFEPYATLNEKAHKKILKELGDKIDTLGEHIKDHEKRIRKLEVRSGL